MIHACFVRCIFSENYSEAVNILRKYNTLWKLFTQRNPCPPCIHPGLYSAASGNAIICQTFHSCWTDWSAVSSLEILVHADLFPAGRGWSELKIEGPLRIQVEHCGTMTKHLSGWPNSKAVEWVMPSFKAPDVGQRAPVSWVRISRRSQDKWRGCVDLNESL